jgi:drug/metabolite transporter (DMT)-like permease
MAVAIAAVNLFSSKVILVKLAYAEGAAPMQVLAIRMATALPFFAVLTVYLLRRGPAERPSTRDFVGMSLLGLTGYYVSSVLDFHGIVYLTSSMERLLLYLYPTFLVILRSVMERSLPRPVEVISLALAYAGIALVYHEEQQLASTNALRGSLLVLGSAACYATYLYFSSRYIDKLGSRLFASYSTAVSCVAILIHAAVVGGGGAPLTFRIIGLCMAVGIFCTVLPTYAIHQAIALIGSSKVGMLGVSGIVFPLVIGALLFREPLTPARLGGVALVLASVALLAWKREPGSRC